MVLNAKEKRNPFSQKHRAEKCKQKTVRIGDNLKSLNHER